MAVPWPGVTVGGSISLAVCPVEMACAASNRAGMAVAVQLRNLAQLG